MRRTTHERLPDFLETRIIRTPLGRRRERELLGVATNDAPDPAEPAARSCGRSERETAMELMLMSKLRLVLAQAKRRAKRVRSNAIDADDLLQEGLLAMVDLLERRDLDEDTRMAFLPGKIRMALRSHVMTYDELIYLPSNNLTARFKMRKYRARHLAEYGREPTDAELRDEFGFSEKRFKTFSEADERRPLSLDAPLRRRDSAEEHTSHDVLFDAEFDQEAMVGTRETETFVRESLELLRQPHRSILTHLFLDEEALSLRKTAERLHEEGVTDNVISHERVRNFRDEGIIELKEIMLRRKREFEGL